MSEIWSDEKIHAEYRRHLALADLELVTLRRGAWEALDSLLAGETEAAKIALFRALLG